MEFNIIDSDAWHFVTHSISALRNYELWEIMFPKGQPFVPPNILFYEDSTDGFFNIFVVESGRARTTYLYGFLSDFLQNFLNLCGFYNHQKNINNLRTFQEQFYKILLLFDMLCGARLMFGWWLVFNPYQQPFDTVRTITDWWLNAFTGAIPLVLGTDYSSMISQILTGLLIDYLRDLAFILPYKKNEGQLLNEEDFKSLNTELAKVLEKCGTEIRIFRGLPSIWSENPIPNGLREYWFTRRSNVTEFLIQNYYENLGINFLPNRVLKDLLEKSKNDTLTVSLLNNFENMSTNLISLKNTIFSLDFSDFHLHL